MTAKNYLEKCKLLRMIADESRERYERLAEIAKSSGHAPMDGATTQFQPDRNEVKMIRMTEAGSEAVEAELDYLEYRAWLFDLLIKIPGCEGIALIERYINERIIKDMCNIKWCVIGSKSRTTRQIQIYLRNGQEMFRELLISEGIDVE